jgi:hypothetical protein
MKRRRGNESRVRCSRFTKDKRNYRPDKKASFYSRKALPTKKTEAINMRHSFYHLRAAIKSQWDASNCEKEYSFENKTFIKLARRPYY